MGDTQGDEEVDTGGAGEAAFVGVVLVALFFALCRGWYTPEVVVSYPPLLLVVGERVAVNCCSSIRVQQSGAAAAASDLTVESRSYSSIYPGTLMLSRAGHGTSAGYTFAPQRVPCFVLMAGAEELRLHPSIQSSPT